MATQEKETIKETELVIHEVEEKSVIVNLDGWRMRVYFDKDFKGHVSKGTTIKVKYTGDIENPHSVKFEKLK
ncbi:hypothetical protein BAOM_3119 [Peribacillus asahii]|uniref:Uncharacterized protein n=1 Tax=Peribacillus asahii TaxID=228899 RepID=A0A3T0KTT6_9BACI|nr:hypothetical protein [Peribacillus asahii]AZV43728.1 hypothetical protein BAOM_3119 [Peribacillus asahii]